MAEPRRYQVKTVNQELPIFNQQGPRGQRQLTDNEQAIRLYELCKSNPSIMLNPSSTKHQIGRQSMNVVYNEVGDRQVTDAHIQMTLKMPKSYIKSLHPDLKKPRAHIYEQNNRFPDPIKLQPVPGTFPNVQEGLMTTGRAHLHDRSRDTIFNQPPPSSDVQTNILPSAREQSTSPRSFDRDHQQSATAKAPTNDPVLHIVHKKVTEPIRQTKSNLSHNTFHTGQTAFTSQRSVSKGSKADEAKLKLQKIRERAAKEQKVQERKLIHQFLVETMQESGTPNPFDQSSDQGVQSAINAGSLLGAGITENLHTFPSSQQSPQQRAEEMAYGDDMIPMVHLQQAQDGRVPGSYPVTGLHTRPRDAQSNIQVEGHQPQLNKTMRNKEHGLTGMPRFHHPKESAFAHTQDTVNSRTSDAVVSIQDAYVITKNQITGSPFSTARQLQKELTRTVTRHMNQKGDKSLEGRYHDHDRSAALHIDLKKQLNTAQSPRGQSTAKPSGLNTQHGKRNFMIHGSFEMPPLKVSSGIPWAEAARLEPDDRINIHANFQNELKKFTNVHGRLQFRSSEDEMLLTGREPAAKEEERKSPASRNLIQS